MKVGIIGAGLIGKKRGEAVVSPHQVCAVFDTHFQQAQSLASHLKTKSVENLELFFAEKPEVVIIATPHSSLAETARVCIEKKIPVLVEKPAGIFVNELEELQRLSKKNNTPVKIGFNHRFHPALLKAKELIANNEIGSVFMCRARYGHGARLGYENEWRCDPKISGGGELIDQGVHLLDLIYWFLGPLAYHSSTAGTLFWNTKVEDNAVVTLKSEKKMATFHVSFSEWKNIFSLELYGSTGKIMIDGLGKSYGQETLTLYQMPPEMGPPKKLEYTFPEEDLSWRHDFENLINHLESGTPLLGDLESALFCLKIVQKVYQENNLGHLPCSV